MNTKQEFIIFINRWISRYCNADASCTFIGKDAICNNKRKLYHGGGNEYKFMARIMPALENARLGDIWRITAREVEDRIYGPQWQIISVDLIESAAIQEIRKFMAYIREKSITPIRCDTLIAAYKEKTLETMLEDRSALDVIKKATPDIKDRIYHAIAAHRSFLGLLGYLSDWRLDCRLTLKLYELYKNDALLRLRTDPYVIYWQGLASFGMAEGIFLRDGGKIDAPYRCRNVVQAVLHEEEVRNGGAFIPREELAKKVSDFVDDGSPFDFTLSEDAISKAVSWLEECEKIYIDRKDGREDIYLRHLYHAEVDVAHSLQALCQAPKTVECSEQEIEQFQAEYKGAGGVRLSPKQCAAVKQMLTVPVSVVTGGPGTGKTFLVKAVIDALSKIQSRAVVQCCAPTGKAAARMPAEASTIDRLIANEPYKNINQTGNRTPDTFFVDEVSMVDTEKFEKLLEIIPIGARLVLIGDQDQLPSIKAGQVLRDLIESGVIHTIQLQERFRQMEDSAIIANAEKINQTAADQDIHLDEQGKGFVFNNKIRSPNKILNAMLDTYAKLLANGNAPKTIQIITWRKSNELGTQNINHCIQERFNPQDEENKVFYGDKEFRLHDRVIHVENNYDLDVMNGKVGKITKIGHTKERALTVQYSFGEVPYSEKDLAELELAYALTAHKCQGSEYGIVIIPIAGRGITRRMLYTAVTRGQQLVLMIGTESALTAGMRGESSDSRASRLPQRLQKLLPPILPEVEQISLFPSAQKRADAWKHPPSPGSLWKRVREPAASGPGAGKNLKAI